MKIKTKSIIKLENGVSIYTGLRYYKKLGKDIAKAGAIDLVILEDGRTPIKIGKVKNIKLDSFSTEQLKLSMKVKTSFNLNMKNREIIFGCVYDNNDRNGEILKFTDIKKPFFYLIDSNVEHLIYEAHKLDFSITNRDGNKVVNSHLTIEQIVKNKG